MRLAHCATPRSASRFTRTAARPAGCVVERQLFPLMPIRAGRRLVLTVRNNDRSESAFHAGDIDGDRGGSIVADGGDDAPTCRSFGLVAPESSYPGAAQGTGVDGRGSPDPQTVAAFRARVIFACAIRWHDSVRSPARDRSASATDGKLEIHRPSNRRSLPRHDVIYRRRAASAAPKRVLQLRDHAYTE
jgi:hypothetical protein